MVSARVTAEEVKGNVLVLWWWLGAADGGGRGLEAELEQQQHQQEEQHCGDRQGMNNTMRGVE